MSDIDRGVYLFLLDFSALLFSNFLIISFSPSSNSNLFFLRVLPLLIQLVYCICVKIELEINP